MNKYIEANSTYSHNCCSKCNKKMIYQYYDAFDYDDPDCYDPKNPIEVMEFCPHCGSHYEWGLPGMNEGCDPDLTSLFQKIHEIKYVRDWDLEDIRKHIIGREKNFAERFPDLPKCLMCDHKVDLTQLGKETLCIEHRLIIDYWFYEEDGAYFHPDVYKDNGVCKNIEEYRAKYMGWYNSLSQKKKDEILVFSGSSGINWYKLDVLRG